MNLMDLLRATLADGGFYAVPAALVGGLLTGLNPCCLPMYPAAAATCCAVREASEFGQAEEVCVGSPGNRAAQDMTTAVCAARTPARAGSSLSVGAADSSTPVGRRSRASP